MLLFLALLLSGCGSLDQADSVHDLRVLAMRSEPAEQVFSVPLYPDGGSPDGGFDLSSVLASLTVQPITVTTLIADPDGGGRSLHYQYSICAQLDDAGRCDLTQKTAYGIQEGDFTPDGGWGELSVTFTPRIDLLEAAVEEDPYHGFDFLPVPVQLHLTGGSEEAWAFKRLVFTMAFSGQPTPSANKNPYIPLLLLDGSPWSMTSVPTVTEGDYDISPVIPDGGQEKYSLPKFTGGSIDFTESWHFDYFATQGSYSSSETGGESALGTQGSVDSTWSSPDGGASGSITYFVVVRDGRGGEGWTVRQARFAPGSPAK